MKKVDLKKWLKETMLFKLNKYSLITIILAIIINCWARNVAAEFNLPFWLDTIGSMVVGIQFGAIAGLFTGAVSSLILVWVYDGLYLYVLIGAFVGFVVGLLFPRNRNKRDPLAIVSLALFTGLVSALMCLPINLYLYDGLTGNSWGDALYHYLSNHLNTPILNAFISEAFVDAPDRILSMFIALILVDFEEHRILKKKKKKWSNLISVLLISVGLSMMFGQMNIEAYDESDSGNESVYESVTYGSEDGIYSAEINAIAQTEDGYIWVGTYSGLYIYDGISFEYFSLDDSIKSVIDLKVDPQGRLWIGTNDSGAFCYDSRTGKLESYNVDKGLDSDSIRCIGFDEEGNTYLGTVLSISKICPDKSVKTYWEFGDIFYARDFDSTEEGKVIGVTNSGVLFMIEDDILLAEKYYERDESVYYRCVSYSGNELLAGTNTNIIDRYLIEDNDLKYVGSINIPGINCINVINYDDVTETFYLCCENGFGSLDAKNYKYTNMSTEDFQNAISDNFVDDQGNIWFSSSKHGLIKYCETPFENINRKNGIDSYVTNALLKDGKLMYIGTDNGLDILNLATGGLVKEDISKEFEGVRVRNILKDSQDNIWVSCYGEVGLVRIDKSGKINKYNNPEDSMIGNRCRSAIELSDGRILAAGSGGLVFIKDGKTEVTIGENDGLNNQYILSLMERDDGSILAATDGDGIYIIRDNKIVGHKGKQEGLESTVVLRIVKCTGGYLYVTSNALYYDENDNIRKLVFPYSNNYDIKITDDGMCWITSSAGIFSVREQVLLNDDAIDYYVLLNENWGLNTKFTANSWNAFDGDNLYLCCIDGIRKLDTENYDISDQDYKMQLKSINIDYEEIYDVDDEWIIPAVSGRIQFNIAINNYSLTNPLVHYYLEGSSNFHDEGMTCHQNEIVPLTFTDLPYGDYKLHIQIIDDNTGLIKKETVVSITKLAMMYEKLYFKLYLAFICLVSALYIVWLFVTINKRSSRIRGLQKDMITDPMTGILNKAGSESALKTACSEDTGIMLMIDLDSFKLVNDLYGHDMGDRILIRFAELLKEATNEEDVVGRLGGDEFVAFLKDVMDEDDVDKLTKFMNREIVKSAKEYMGDDMNIPLGTSIGAVRVPVEGRDFEKLFRFADKALYLVKQNGKHGYAFYQKTSESKERDEENKDKNNLKQIKKIIGERNEGKGAYLVNFDKLQTLYKFMNRNDKEESTKTGFIRFIIETSKDERVSDEVKENFEECLVSGLRKNDIVSVYAGSYFVLCPNREEDDFSKIAQDIIDSWKKDEEYKDYNVIYEIENVG